MIELNTLITGGVGILTTIVGSWASWVFARRKYNSEVDNNLIENMQQSLEFYKKLSDDNRERLEATLEEVKELRSRNDSLEKELKEVRNQMFDIMANICMDLTCARRVTELSTKKASKKSSTTKS